MKLNFNSNKRKYSIKQVAKGEITTVKRLRFEH